MALDKLLIMIMCLATARNQKQSQIVINSGTSKPDLKGRIWNGEKALPGQFPYQALLYISFGDGINALCGGSLISARNILTAAHCCYGVKNMTVFLGLVDMAEAKADYVQKIKTPSTSFEIHEEYNTDTIANDICLLTLPTPARINSNISAITLPAASDFNPSQYNNGSGVISGWGQSSKYEGPNPILQWSTITMEPHHLCVQNYKFINEVSNSQLCSSRFPTSGPCHGDSGGPLTITDSTGNPFEIGLVSWGVGSCGTKNAVVYTYIPAYIDWIKNRMTPN